MKTKSILVITALSLLSVACKKNQCANCHYDGPGGAEVEMGEYCGDELEDIEVAGYSDGTTTYVVHCGEH